MIFVGFLWYGLFVRLVFDFCDEVIVGLYFGFVGIFYVCLDL